MSARRITFAEVLENCDRAKARAARWPDWMREMSGFEGSHKDDPLTQEATRSAALSVLRGPLYGQPWIPDGEDVEWTSLTDGGCSDLVGVSDKFVYARIMENVCGELAIHFSGFEFTFDGPLARAQSLVWAILTGETYKSSGVS